MNALIRKPDSLSLKELLLEMPDVGDDRDFERPGDRGEPNFATRNVRDVANTGVDLIDPFD